MTGSKSSYAIFAGGMLAGLVLGVLIGLFVLKSNAPAGKVLDTSISMAGQGARGDAYEDAFEVVEDSVSWSPLPIKWKNLGPFSEAGVAPATFSTPTEAYSYGAVSHPLPAPIVANDAVLRIDIEKVKGVVGISLVNPVGDPLVSQEQGLTGEDGKRSVFFKVRAKDLPASILLRNYGDTSGAKGSITVTQVSYAPVTAFSEAQLAALEKMGLNKGLVK